MSSLSPAESAIVERSREQDSLTLVEQWSQINSGTRNLAGLATIADMLAQAFSVLPGTLRLLEPAPVDAILADGQKVMLDHGKHLHLNVRPEAPVRLLLTGHMDTVFSIDHPFQSLHWYDSATLGGPGVADMKGGIAVMLAALKAVEASPYASRIGYEVLINSDEETGSLSSAKLIAECATGKLAALTYEPALPDGTLAGARGGTGNFSLTVRGKTAHAGRNPEDGRNAIVAAAALTLRLFEARSSGLLVNPARIDGGGPNNVVPDLAILRVNLRPQSNAETARAQQILEDAAAETAKKYEVEIAVHGGFNRPPKPIDPGAAKLFALVRTAGNDLGLEIGWRATGGVCDGNNIAACGVPVVDTMGVRGGAIHSMDEFLIVESLAERAALSALTISRIAEQGTL